MVCPYTYRDSTLIEHTYTVYSSHTDLLEAFAGLGISIYKSNATLRDFVSAAMPVQKHHGKFRARLAVAGKWQIGPQRSTESEATKFFQIHPATDT